MFPKEENENFDFFIEEEYELVDGRLVKVEEEADGNTKEGNEQQ